MSERAVILAGGKGTRLRPYTIVFPKPLMPIGDFPILELVIRQLAENGFGHITLAVNHQAELIEAFFKDGAKWGVKIDYSLEDKPLGTMGPLKRIEDLPEDFLVMNGDVMTDLSFSSFLDRHRSSGEIFSISSYQRNQVSDYGVLDVDGEGALSGFREKPSVSFQVSMGVYAVNRKALDFIPAGSAFGFDQLMLDFLKAGKIVNVLPHNGIWLDIGRPDDYEKAIETFAESRKLLLKTT
ncbi:MAG: nucleotidyltransferase family protein [Bacteroidia bacterium]|nr:nucleotidyltransferase family protein [Bacteroidia bacterium]